MLLNADKQHTFAQVSPSISTAGLNSIGDRVARLAVTLLSGYTAFIYLRDFQGIFHTSSFGTEVTEIPPEIYSRVQENHPEGVLEWLEPLTFGGRAIRFMAGAPIRRSGVRIGGLYVTELEARPQGLTRRETDDLLNLAGFVGEHLEAAQEQKRRCDEQSQADQSAFISRMNHDLRTPINAILGFAQLLDREGLSEEQIHDLEHIWQGGRDLLLLLEDLADVARSGLQNMSLDPVQVRDVIGVAIERIRQEAEQRGVPITIPDTPGIGVVADERVLKQVLQCLFAVALKHCQPAGGIAFTASKANDGWIRLAVSAGGAVLRPEQLTGLFKPASLRNGSVASESVQLALARKRTELMHGRIGAESEPGRSLTLWVEFPAPLQCVPGAGLSTKPTVLYIGAGEEDVACIAEMSLQNQARFTAVGNCDEAFLHAYETTPDLILLDQNMRQPSGLEILLRLRNNAITGEVPVLVVTCDGPPADRRSWEEHGVNGWLTKPVSAGTLVDALKKMGRCD
jgi:signal transduction histidine kinase/CheY-like chemotaxis protein